MSSFKYLQKGNKVFVSFANGRMMIPWIKRLVPKAEAIEILPTSVTLSKSSYTIKVEGTYTLSATVAPETATVKTVSWSSSNEEVATVNDSGKVTGVGVGECKIIAKSTRDPSIKGECALTVESKE